MAQTLEAVMRVHMKVNGDYCDGQCRHLSGDTCTMVHQKLVVDGTGTKRDPLCILYGHKVKQKLNIVGDKQNGMD